MATGVWECGHCGQSFDHSDFKVTSLIYDKKLVCEDCALQEDSIWLENIDKKKICASPTP